VRGTLRTASLQLRTAARVVRSGRPSVGRLLAPLDERMVFVLGSPRSGTTFLARAIGSCPNFVDLGEVAAFKAEIPALAGLEPAEASRRIHGLLTVTCRLALAGGLRAVEQTPEAAFLGDAVLAAFPEATLVHVVRDGRDVVCSFRERGWLNAGRVGTDDAGLPLGAHRRFWVEAGRGEEFERASDVRRAAWAWRRYVTAARSLGERVTEVRYERLAAEPAAVADQLSVALDAPLAALEEALRAAHGASVGRFRRELTPADLLEVEAEAGALLADLGYLQ